MSGKRFYFLDQEKLGPSAPQVDAILDWAERNRTGTITWQGVPISVKKFFDMVAVNNY